MSGFKVERKLVIFSSFFDYDMNEHKKEWWGEGILSGTPDKIPLPPPLFLHDILIIMPRVRVGFTGNLIILSTILHSGL